MPEYGKLKILFIAKTPTLKSVQAGHYFQGKQGRSFWNKLAQYGILTVPFGSFEDDYLLANNYGITDIVKVPRNYGIEPSDQEYQAGLERILKLINKYQPIVLVFVYKNVLDNIIRLHFELNIKADYGLNKQLEPLFKSKVFAFPMPGTQECTSEIIERSMTELAVMLRRIP